MQEAIDHAEKKGYDGFVIQFNPGGNNYGKVSFKSCGREIQLSDLSYNEKNGWYTYIRTGQYPVPEVNNGPNEQDEMYSIA